MNKFTGEITIISYKSSSFKDKSGKDVEFSQVAFHDKEGNKLTMTVPKKHESDICLEKDVDGDEFTPVKGEATIEIVSQTYEGKNRLKLNLIAFK